MVARVVNELIQYEMEEKSTRRQKSAQKVGGHPAQ